VQVTPWRDLDLETQKEEYEKQKLAWKYRDTKKQWARNYVRMARALADEFGEEEVLDILEKAWWDLEYEGGSTWRSLFEQDPAAALEEVYHFAHDLDQSLTISPQDVSYEPGRYELIHYHCHLKEVFMEEDERRIGISWCMGDAAGVRGLHPRAMLDFRNSQIRGDSFCYHVRAILDEAPDDPDADLWTREKSEQIGWRSIKRLEE